MGPYSQGTTDADGKFTLVSRYKEDGAVPGKHTLALEYSDISETAMADLRANLADAQETGDKAEFDKVKKEIAKLKTKLKGRPVLKARYTKIFDIPADGLADMQIELSDM